MSRPLSARLHSLVAQGLLFFGSLTGTASAQLPTPQILQVSPAVSGKSSDLWRVEVWNGSAWVDTNAYQYSRVSGDFYYWQGANPVVHWTTIGLTGKARVRATRLPRWWSQGGNTEYLTAAQVLPTKYGIAPTVTLSTAGAQYLKGQIEFTIEAGQNVYIECGTGTTATPPTSPNTYDTLFLFTNPPKPAIDTSTMHVFSAGVTNIGQLWVPPNGKRIVYLDHGAWVVGSIDTTDYSSAGNKKSGFEIIGPGVLSGEWETYEQMKVDTGGVWSEEVKYAMVYNAPVNLAPPGAIVQPQTHHIAVRGPTLLASPFVNFYIESAKGPHQLTDVHVLSPWTYQTDSFGIYSNATIHRCTSFVSDNQLQPEFIHEGSVTVTDCLIAGRNAFCVGYGYFQNPVPGRAYLSDISVILQRPAETNLGAVFTAHLDAASSNDVVSDHVYRNITVDGDVPRLFFLENRDNLWQPGTGTLGSIKGVKFENVTLNGNQAQRSIVKGYDANNMMGTSNDPIVFKNLYIGNPPVKVTSSNYTTYFDTNAFVTLVFQ
jgi:hypothetical protein